MNNNHIWLRCCFSELTSFKRIQRGEMLAVIEVMGDGRWEVMGAREIFSNCFSKPLHFASLTQCTSLLCHKIVQYWSCLGQTQCIHSQDKFGTGSGGVLEVLEV